MTPMQDTRALAKLVIFCSGSVYIYCIDSTLCSCSHVRRAESSPGPMGWFLLVSYWPLITPESAPMSPAPHSVASRPWECGFGRLQRDVGGALTAREHTRELMPFP